jgi:hypothetical protein
MNKKIPIQFLLAVLIYLFAISPVWAEWGKTTGYIHKDTNSMPPNKVSPSGTSTVVTEIYCYNILPPHQEIECTFTHKVIDLKTPYVPCKKDCSEDYDEEEVIANNGGHFHNYNDGTRPFASPLSASSYDYYFNSPKLADCVVKGKSTALIGHRLPEVAGRIMTETLIGTPKGWECVFGCWTDTEWRYQTTLDIGVHEYKVTNNFIDWLWFTAIDILPLTELPDPGTDDHYKKKRNLEDTHPKGHYGTSYTIEELKEIAEKNFDLTDRILSINDISLPKGGLNDYKATWGTPHATHRAGVDADLNVDKACYYDTELRNAVESVSGGPKAFPYLQCEIAGKRAGQDEEKGYGEHIDFDNSDKPCYYANDCPK